MGTRTAATATQLIATDSFDDVNTGIIKAAEGATSKPASLLTLDPYLQVVDLHWLRDGSGFVFATRNSLQVRRHIWEYEFETNAAMQVTNVQFEGVTRRLAMFRTSKIAFQTTERLHGYSSPSMDTATCG